VANLKVLYLNQTVQGSWERKMVSREDEEGEL
jgi:hypothetical protein